MITEKKLIEGCQKGDRSAQKALYEQYRRQLMGICLRYAESREEAEDWLQEGFIEVFGDLYRYKPTGSFEGWLRKVVVNVCLQQLRKRRLLFTGLDMQQVFEGFVAENDGFSGFQQEESMILMLQQLPVGYRAVFNLFVMEGYSHKEISDMLGIPEVTCRSHLSRAKAILRKMLEKTMV